MSHALVHVIMHPVSIYYTNKFRLLPAVYSRLMNVDKQLPDFICSAWLGLGAPLFLSCWCDRELNRGRYTLRDTEFDKRCKLIHTWADFTIVIPHFYTFCELHVSITPPPPPHPQHPQHACLLLLYFSIHFEATINWGELNLRNEFLLPVNLYT